jgi:hypothetical protein
MNEKWDQLFPVDFPKGHKLLELAARINLIIYKSRKKYYSLFRGPILKMSSSTSARGRERTGILLQKFSHVNSEMMFENRLK